LKKVDLSPNNKELLKRREKTLSRLIIAISILIGVLFTLLVSGLMDFIANK